MLLRLRGLIVGMRVVRFCFSFLLSVCRKTRVRFVFFFCVIFPCFHLRVASLRNSFADGIECNLVLMGAARFLPFLSFAHSFYICMHMSTRIRAASGLIISCIYRVYDNDIVYPASGLCAVNFL